MWVRIEDKALELVLAKRGGRAEDADWIIRDAKSKLLR